MLHSGQILRLDCAGIKLALQRLQCSVQLSCRCRQSPQRLTFLRSAHLILPGSPGERHGIIPSLGQKCGGLLQLHAAVGQLSNGRLGGQGLSIGLCA